MNSLQIKRLVAICYCVNGIALGGIISPKCAIAQIEMKKTGSYTQNFDTLSATGSVSWKDNSTIPGWYWQNQIQTTYLTYTADDGKSSIVGKKSYGVSGNSDRSMGILPDKDYTFAIGLVLQNKSSSNITQVSVSYTGEQWRNGGYNSSQALLFGYIIGSTLNPVFTSGTGWNSVSDLRFYSPIFGPPAKALNGNDPANSVVFKDVSLPNINIPPNSYLQLRWYKQSEYPYPHGLAIDDVKIKWVIPATPSLSVTPVSISGLYGIQDSVLSIAKPYLLSGEDLLTGGNPIVITAPTNYEISFDNQSFSKNLSLTYTSPILAPQIIYVRFSSTAKTGSYTNDLISHNIGSVLMKTLPLSGNVYEMNWVENFETGTKTDYTEGQISCTKGPWLFKEALIGTATEDFKMGKKSARIQINKNTNVAGSLTMNFDKTNGAGDVLISYSNYGSDKGGKWQLQSSVNSGTTWENEGAEISCGDYPEMVHYSINKAGNIRFRIIQFLTTPASTINIDDIAIADYGTSTTIQWTGAVSDNWATSGNWIGGVVPGTDAEVEIPNVANKPVCNNSINLKSLIIRNGAVLTLKAGLTLTVTGNCSFEGENCMILKSPNNHGAAASFICNGKISGGGTIMVERYIIKYIGETDGWHFISSPVDNPLISDSFKPGSDDDLYAYRESDNLWINQKLVSNNLVSFNNGEGYLASYFTEITRSLSGIPNNSDIHFTNLTLTNDRGWHLLGNPFTSGLTWFTGWNTVSINSTAKILNSGGTYSDLEEGEIIPSMNGFFVRAINNTNSITIPTSARIHAIENGWKSKKASSVKKIKLTINSTTDNTYSETKIIINDKATNSFDAEYDSYFLEGMPGTPSFYSILNNGQKLSTNCVPSASSLLFNFQFSKGLSNEYTLKAEISDDWIKSATFNLTDKLVKKNYLLTNSSSFTFKSDSTDVKDRFSLQIDVSTGINSSTEDKNCTLYSFQKTVFVRISENIKSGNVSVYDVSGKLLKILKLQSNSLDFQLEKSGTYIIKVLFNNKMFSKKIRIN
jgi:hypothetical protein